MMSKLNLTIRAMVPLALVAATADAGGLILSRPSPYATLSVAHTDRGVSQFLSQQLTYDSYTLKLWNPTRAVMVAAVLVYTSPQLGFPGDTDDLESNSTPGQYLGCYTLRLPSHGAVRLDDDFHNNSGSIPDDYNGIILGVNNGLPINEDDVRKYVEVISVPEERISLPGGTLTRMANGLGLAVVGSGEGNMQPSFLHPSRFAFPSDSLQRQAAANCLCQAAEVLDKPTLWQNFGVNCSF